MPTMTHVQRWGNSLAVRIPKAFAAETGLNPNDAVAISVQDGHIVLTPVKDPSYTLAELMEGFTDDQRPAEWDMGAPVGDEVW